MTSLNPYNNQKELVSQNKRVPTYLRVLYIAFLMYLGALFYTPAVTLLENLKTFSTIPITQSSTCTTSSHQHPILTNPTATLTSKNDLITLWVNHPFHVDSTKIVISMHA